MKYVNDLSGRQKARIISLLIISILLFLSSSEYVRSIQNSGQQIDYVENMTVDGSDFTPIANLFVAGTNGFLQFLTSVLAVIAIVIISLILLIPWRLIAIRKDSEISKKEPEIAKAILVLFVVITPVTGFILTHLTFDFSVLLLTLIPALFLLVLSVLPLKKAYKRIYEKEEKI